jgi:hypothetical protein
LKLDFVRNAVNADALIFRLWSESYVLQTKRERAVYQCGRACRHAIIVGNP